MSRLQTLYSLYEKKKKEKRQGWGGGEGGISHITQRHKYTEPIYQAFFLIFYNPWFSAIRNMKLS